MIKVNTETAKLLNRVHPVIMAELAALSEPWQLKQGSKHIKIFINNDMVGILPAQKDRSSSANKGVLNVRSQIRRHCSKRGAA